MLPQRKSGLVFSVLCEKLIGFCPWIPFVPFLFNTHAGPSVKSSPQTSFWIGGFWIFSVDPRWLLTWPLLSIWGQGPGQYLWFLRGTDGSQDRVADSMHEWGQASPPLPFLLLRMPQALVPFELSVLTHPLLFDFLTGGCSASPNFPILSPCAMISPPRWNNAWSNAISFLGLQLVIPVRFPFFFFFTSLTNRPGSHNSAGFGHQATCGCICVLLIIMKILGGRIFCLVLP